jgi:acetyl-CoA carboxylase biotin carboxyl carrier protein
MGIPGIVGILGIDRERYLLSLPWGGHQSLEEHMTDIEAHITGTVWKIECAVGDTIAEGDTVAILESMKMEMPVEAEDAGTVTEIRCEEGQAVNEGDTLVVLD